jgi:hypothetical protein
MKVEENYLKIGEPNKDLSKIISSNGTVKGVSLASANKIYNNRDIEQELSDKLNQTLDKILPPKITEFPPPANVVFPTREQILKFIVKNKINMQENNFIFSDKDLIGMEAEIAQENLAATISVLNS